MSAPHITEAARGTYLVSANNTNWVLLEDGGSVTLIDAGYPGSLAAVESSIWEIGRSPGDIEAVLVTHAHVDHIGSLPQLCARYEVPVFTSEEESRHAHREYLQQATPLQVAANAWRPGVLSWSLHVMRVGATRHVSIPGAQAFPGTGALDLPGNPVPVPLPGHTSGHCGYHLPAVGAVVSGDALVTGHATSRTTGPQMLLPMFHHDLPEATRSLDALSALDADLLLPGHGPVHRGDLGAAVDRAREAPTSH